MTNSNEQVKKNTNENEDSVAKTHIEEQKIPGMGMRYILLLVGCLQTFFCSG